MPYRVQPLKEFLVRPALPASLSRLSELAYNLVWSWDHAIRSLFRRLEPTLWKDSNHNPILMLGRISQAALDKAAADPRYLAMYRRACERHDTYLHTAPMTEGSANDRVFLDGVWTARLHADLLRRLGRSVRRSFQSRERLRYTTIGVGLLYQRGYFQQSLNPDGWQQERNPLNDFYTLPVRPCEDENGAKMLVSVALPPAKCSFKVWHLDVGRIKLYLLDTNIPENKSAGGSRDYRQLYGGDTHKRIRQEIVLGIGGLRALKRSASSPLFIT